MAIHRSQAGSGSILYEALDLSQRRAEIVKPVAIHQHVGLQLLVSHAFQNGNLDIVRNSQSSTVTVFTTLVQSNAVEPPLQSGRKVIQLTRRRVKDVPQKSPIPASSRWVKSTYQSTPSLESVAVVYGSNEVEWLSFRELFKRNVRLLLLGSKL